METETVGESSQKTSNRKRVLERLPLTSVSKLVIALFATFVAGTDISERLLDVSFVSDRVLSLMREPTFSFALGAVAAIGGFLAFRLSEKGVEKKGRGNHE